MEGKDLNLFHYQHPGCYWPCEVISHGINTNSINLVILEYLAPAPVELSWYDVAHRGIAYCVIPQICLLSSFECCLKIEN